MFLFACFPCLECVLRAVCLYYPVQEFPHGCGRSVAHAQSGEGDRLLASALGGNAKEEGVVTSRDVWLIATCEVGNSIGIVTIAYDNDLEHRGPTDCR